MQLCRSDTKDAQNTHGKLIKGRHQRLRKSNYTYRRTQMTPLPAMTDIANGNTLLKRNYVYFRISFEHRNARGMTLSLTTTNILKNIGWLLYLPTNTLNEEGETLGLLNNKILTLGVSTQHSPTLEVKLSPKQRSIDQNSSRSTHQKKSIHLKRKTSLTSNIHKLSTPSH